MRTLCRAAGICPGIVVLLGLALTVQANTSTQIVAFPEATIAAGVTDNPPPAPCVFTVTFQQLDPATTTLNQVTFNWEFDFDFTMTIAPFSGGSGGATVQGNFSVNDAYFGGDGTGTGYGGGGPAVFVIPFTAPSSTPPGSLVITADTNPDAFNQFIGTGLATFKWDTMAQAGWSGPPDGGSVDLLMKDTSYIKVTYDYTVICPRPFADADRDEDVDQDDFGIWQRCFTGLGHSTPGMDICTCLDRNQNDVVDSGDYEPFTRCWSGPTVTADASCESAQ